MSPHPVTQKIAAAREKSAARAAHIPASPNAVPPLTDAPTADPSVPTMQQLQAESLAREGAEALRRAQDFFAASRRVAVEGLVRFARFEDAAREVLALTAGIDVEELRRRQYPRLETYLDFLAKVRGIVQAPKVAKEALTQVDALTASDCKVSDRDRRAGHVVPPSFHDLRVQLHRVGPGADVLESHLTDLRDEVRRAVGWYAGELARQTPPVAG